MSTNFAALRPVMVITIWHGCGDYLTPTRIAAFAGNLEMRGSQFAELSAFVAVAEHRSFTKAAAQLSISRAGLSQIIRSLEERLGVRLLNRTTRSVALTEAGERLLSDTQPVLEGIEKAIEGVNAFRDKPSGTLRLNTQRAAARAMVRSFFPGSRPVRHLREM
jgi:DNA-binding transcriptional LysR family regulator